MLRWCMNPAAESASLESCPRGADLRGYSTLSVSTLERGTGYDSALTLHLDASQAVHVVVDNSGAGAGGPFELDALLR